MCAEPREPERKARDLLWILGKKRRDRDGKSRRRHGQRGAIDKYAVCRRSAQRKPKRRKDDQRGGRGENDGKRHRVHERADIAADDPPPAFAPTLPGNQQRWP